MRDGIAELVVNSLSDIRDRKMLKMGFLAVLPNESDSLASFYEPIRKAVVHAFKTKPLTPTRSGTHASAPSLYRGPAKISKVLQDQDLSLLTSDKPPLWAANPPQQNQREDRFLDSLEIESWGWTELSYAFINNKQRDSLEAWIAQKDDAWMMSFYALLGEACEIHDESVYVQNVRIVRVEQNQSTKWSARYAKKKCPSVSVMEPTTLRKKKYSPENICLRNTKPSTWLFARSAQPNTMNL